jgi:serine/threonine protein kinase
MVEDQVDSHNVDNWTTGQQILNTFVIQDILGVGGLSRVYLVKHISEPSVFALKTVNVDRFNQNGLRQDFFRELRTWIDLPECPNIAHCRFFKTIQDRLGIFSEYVNGGTLLDWIEAERLVSMERILDVAIQCSLGLQVAHDSGVIHQDVKPTNILMTEDGQPKITDFGISSVIAPGSDLPVSAEEPGYSQTSVGYTPGYCSPEQYHQVEITRATDIWSFGIVLMEMLTGKPVTPIGYLADEALKYDKTVETQVPFPGIRESFVPTLERCLAKDPEERWSSFGDLADALSLVYRKETGQEYIRPSYNIRQAVSDSKTYFTRKTITGVKWDDPEIWLERACMYSNSDYSEQEELLLRRSSSRTSQALTDLEIYETAQDLYTDVISKGFTAGEVDLANLLLNKALIQESVSDYKGAIETRNQAVKVLEPHVYSGSRSDLINELAGVYLNQGWAYIRMGEIDQGLRSYDKALSIRDNLFQREGSSELQFDLAKVYMNKGFALCKKKDVRGSVECFDKAQSILEELVYTEGYTEHAKTLATFYMNRAVASRSFARHGDILGWFERAGHITREMGEFDKQSKDIHFLSTFYINRGDIARDFGKDKDALKFYDKAIQMLEFGIYQEEQRALLGELALANAGKSYTISNMGDFNGALSYLNEAIRIREQLLGREGRDDQADELSKLYQSKAMVYVNLDNLGEAIRQFEKSVNLLKWLVEQNNQIQLREYLAKAYLHQAALFREQGDYHSVIRVYSPAIELVKHLVYQENRTDLMVEFAKAICSRAEAFMLTGNRKEAKEEAKEGVFLLYSEYKRSHRDDLMRTLNWAKLSLKDVLKQKTTE